MDKLNFVKNGVLRLPPGFRFHPTDEELVVQYLKRKVFAYPLPASIIPEVDVCKSDPWDLPGNSTFHTQLENWVLCRIFLKKRSNGKNEEEAVKSHNGNRAARGGGEKTRPVFYDFMAAKDKTTDLNLAPASSYSGSSGITEEASCHEPDDHEENSTSCNNSPSTFRRKPSP
ncbi:hypothetical protein RJ639_032977 [Escallonia herrerae]|uniref:NAC domain-containing protein n=1 Tax=Escallonia herrerae TaxID=1293975 RepID=A0AA88XCK7_9ASTE|nr:hypothetical protein RJ639_032977 [Escallonia herrerae]